MGMENQLNNINISDLNYVYTNYQLIFAILIMIAVFIIFKTWQFKLRQGQACINGENNHTIKRIAFIGVSPKVSLQVFAFKDQEFGILVSANGQAQIMQFDTAKTKLDFAQVKTQINQELKHG
jgi:hypothetical protein